MGHVLRFENTGQSVPNMYLPSFPLTKLLCKFFRHLLCYFVAGSRSPSVRYFQSPAFLGSLTLRSLKVIYGRFPILKPFHYTKSLSFQIDMSLGEF